MAALLDGDVPYELFERAEKATLFFSKMNRREFEGHKKKVHCVDWSTDGVRLASASDEKIVRVWNVKSSGPVQSMELRGHEAHVDYLCWHPSARDVLATASGDKTVRIWDVRAPKCTQVINTDGQNINGAWSSDGRSIAIGNKKDLISIIDTNSWTITHKHGFEVQVNEMTWDRTNTLLLLTMGNGMVDMFRVPSFERVSSLQAHTGPCYCLDMDPTHGYLAVGSADAMVTLWDTSELVCVYAFTHDTPTRSVSFSHNGAYLATASEAPRVDIFHVESRMLVHSLQARGEMNSVSWNPQLSLLAFAGDGSNPKDAGMVSVFGFPSK